MDRDATPTIAVTALDIAERFIGQKEMRGRLDNPQIMAMLKLVASWPQHDEVPWCSAFVAYVCWLLGLPRSTSLRARSWMEVGRTVPLNAARPGFDVVILSRGHHPQGHVGFLSVLDGAEVHLLGGNQGNRVSIQNYPTTRVVGVVRLLP